MSRYTPLLAGIFAVAFAAPEPALAQNPPSFVDAPPESDPPPAPPPAASAGKVEVEILCARATKRDTRVDDGLQTTMKHLAPLGYTGLSMLSRNEAELEVGDGTTFPLEGGRKVKVKVIDRSETAARLRIQMFRPDGEQQLDTTVNVHRNRSFMIMGPRIGEDVLVLPVTARY